MFNLGDILREGFETLKKNYVLAVPAVIAALVRVILVSFVIVSTENMAVMPIVGLGALVIEYFAHGVSLAMAREVFEQGETSLKTGINVATSFLFHFFVTSIILSIIVGTGFMLVLLPGFAAMFVLMFTFPSIIMHGLAPSEAIKNSYNLVRSNLSESLLLFAVLAAIIIAITVVSLMFAAIPVLGQFVGVVLNGAMGGFSALVLLRAYMIFVGQPATEPQKGE